jgi:AraC-like DNA-binding protein
MSRIGHRAVTPTALGTVVSSWDLEPGVRFDHHEHPTHQLSIAGRSAVAMVVGKRTYVVPRARALWVPAGTPHSVEPIGAAEMTTLWFDPARCPVRWSRPTVVTVDGLVEALVDRLRDGSLSAAARTRSERVLFDALAPVPASDLDLALPTDDRARRVAEAILIDPSDDRTLADWGRIVGASERTLMRRFRAETGRGFQEWRKAARLVAALRLLLTDAPVAVIASSVGYSTASAFGAAFRRALGAPPSAFRSS